MSGGADWHAHVTVATVVEREGRFLLVEEQADEGIVLNQPAGHLDPGESLFTAAMRETLEETGCEVELEALLGISQYTSPANGVTYLRSTFAARLLREHLNAELDKEILRTLWMTPAEMRAESGRMRSPLVMASVEQYLAGQRWPLDLVKYIP
ncbi:MAG: NUDIX hydrolase [Halieaceae bacterium]|jgi:8-oxo-dGTP pyrophosphatase MutT (NUDIX family)|nr:NUDIX hydrolase [Halieaceae bacterium]